MRYVSEMIFITKDAIGRKLRREGVIARKLGREGVNGRKSRREGVNGRKLRREGVNGTPPGGASFTTSCIDVHTHDHSAHALHALGIYALRLTCGLPLSWRCSKLTACV